MKIIAYFVYACNIFDAGRIQVSSAPNIFTEALLHYLVLAREQV